MTATTQSHGSNAGCVVVGLIVLVVIAWVSSTTASLDAVSTYPQNPNVPIAAPVSQHALENHIEAEDIQRKCDQNKITCTKVYESLTVKQRLYLFWNACSTLVDGKIETIGGKNITAYSKPIAYWNGVIARDNYQLRVVDGRCP